MTTSVWWSVFGFAGAFSLIAVIVPVALKTLIEVRSKPHRDSMHSR